MSLVTSLKWNSSSQILVQVLSFVGAIILARLLPPSDFGTVSMVTVISSFSLLFLDAGFSTALIQKKSISKQLISTIFWLSISLSLLFSLSLILFAGAIAKFYDKPILVELCYILSSTFILGALAQIPRVLLTRKMDFRSIALSRIIATLVAYCVAIFMASSGFGIWSIVTQILLGAVIVPIILWAKAKWTPSLEFSFSALKEISSFSLNTFFNNLLEYWVQNLDGLLIGKKFGAGDMGIFNRSFTTVLLPVRTISTSINGVLFPKYSQSQDNQSEFKRLYLKTLRLQSFFVFPAMAILSLLSDSLVLLVFGENWAEMVPIVRLFSLMAILSTTFSANDTSISALGRADLLFRVGLIEKSIFVVGTFIGLRYGIIGLAYAKVCSALIAAIPKYWLFTHVSKINLKTQLSQYSKILLSTVLALATIIAIQHIIPFSELHIQVPTLLIFGGIVYLACTWALKEETIMEIIKKLKG